MRRLIADPRGGTHSLEWLAALTFVLLLALGLSAVGRDAAQRIAGRERGRDVNDLTNRDISIEMGAYAPDALGRANHRGAAPPRTTEPSPTVAPACPGGFATGALHAFVNGEGELVGDLIGMKDADLIAFFLHRPPSQVVGDVHRTVVQAAPLVIAVAPGLLSDAGAYAAASIRTDPLGTARNVLDAVVVDSIRTTAGLAVDGWHGAGVLIAAAQRGDCIAFGSTLRRGVSNLPELALNGGDAIGLSSAAAGLGTKALRSGALRRLATGAGARALAAVSAKRVLTLGANHAGAPIGAALRHGTGVLAKRASLSAAATAARTSIATTSLVARWTARETVHAGRQLASRASAAASDIVRHLQHGDVPGAARSGGGFGRAAFASIGDTATAAKVGAMSLVNDAGGLRAHISHLADAAPAYARAPRADHHALGVAGVCKGRNCRPGTGLCFAAGTLVHTPKGRAPIETLRAGDRVQTTGAMLSPDESAVAPTWRIVELEMQRGAHDVVRMKLLRSPAWIARTGATPGHTIRLSLLEMGLEGPSRVVSIRTPRAITDGPGHLVLATFESDATDVLELHFEHTREVLQPTSRHRLYSVARNDWIAAGKLRVGERIRTRTGEVVIASIRKKRGVHTVYNLEVETDHSYYVGDVGALSHNNDPYEDPIEEWRERWPILFPSELDDFRSAHSYVVEQQDAFRILARDGSHDDFLDSLSNDLFTINSTLREELPGFGAFDANEREINQMRERIDNDLKQVVGKILFERRANADAAWSIATPTLEDLALLTNEPHMDVGTVRELLSFAEGRRYRDAVAHAQQSERELAVAQYGTRLSTAHAFAGEDLETTLRHAVPYSRNPLYWFIRDAGSRFNRLEVSYEIGRRFTSDEDWLPSALNRALSLDDNVVRWTSSVRGDPDAMVPVEDQFRTRLASLAQAFGHLYEGPGIADADMPLADMRTLTELGVHSPEGKSFLRFLDEQGKSLRIDAGVNADPNAPWVLDERGNVLRMRPFVPTRDSHLLNDDIARELGATVINNLCRDTISITTFLNAVSRFLDLP